MTEEQTIRAQTGTCVRVRPSLTGCPHAWHGAQFRRPCRVKRSSLPTSATTAPSVTPIRLRTKAASIWHRPVWSMWLRPARDCWRENRQPDVPVVGFSGDGAFGIAVNELTAIGRGEWPAITQVVFRNYQWGAEKRNSTLWFDDNFVGTELDEGVSYAGIATCMWSARRCCTHPGRADSRACQAV